MSSPNVKDVVIVEAGDDWGSHPFAPGLERKVLLTKKDHGAGASIFLVKAQSGADVPEHFHENSDDIAYVLSGTAKMFVEGVGEFRLRKGMFLRVPKNLKHRVYDFDDDFMVLNIFVPATV